MNRQHETSIKRGGVASISPKLYDRTISKHCPDCEAKGIRNQSTILGERKYLPDESIGPDAKDWKQCYLCGHRFHRRKDIQTEGQLVSTIEATNSPYEEVSGHIGGIDRRKLGKRGKHERTKINLISDPDVKAELKKGAKLISYSETI